MLNAKQAYYFVYGVFALKVSTFLFVLNLVYYVTILSLSYADALKRLGFDLESVASHEPDPALGNGGLGRLASCFLVSMATLNYPAWGYVLRYKYGLFKQIITKDGQEEAAENWL
ncbi:BnaC06g30230D [Brassica napus]|uniref:Alpha-1,4 glucan phosphorylase n=1 Tax=Brassica napus TaxID=3708 RepID=A0A078HJG6_BRANA|nr:unnamed protein product [Brassica napus]CDY38600.1 BnaC06g30230D [Brassica napus]